MAGGLWDAEDNAACSISERWFDLTCTPDLKPAVANLLGDAVWTVNSSRQPRALHRGHSAQPGCRPSPTSLRSLALGLHAQGLLVGLLLQISDVSPRLSPIVKAAISRNERPFSRAAPARRNPRHATPWRADVHHSPPPRQLLRALPQPRKLELELDVLQLPDRFSPLPDDVPERIEKMFAHCLPTIVQIVRKTQEDYVNAGLRRFLDVFYLLTNEQGPWLDELKAEFKLAGWRTLGVDPNHEDTFGETSFALA
ncbi:hypothetical protein K438DRAFT_1773647 [Mycena galopus ATCC 62051]|nr:hypothetical protein K438DRAFT_1773647 [Mycena galopus ATCC 62051]